MPQKTAAQGVDPALLPRRWSGRSRKATSASSSLSPEKKVPSVASLPKVAFDPTSSPGANTLSETSTGSVHAPIPPRRGRPPGKKAAAASKATRLAGAGNDKSQSRPAPTPVKKARAGTRTLTPASSQRLESPRPLGKATFPSPASTHPPVSSGNAISPVASTSQLPPPASNSDDATSTTVKKTRRTAARKTPTSIPSPQNQRRRQSSSPPLPHSPLSDTDSDARTPKRSAKRKRTSEEREEVGPEYVPMKSFSELLQQIANEKEVARKLKEEEDRLKVKAEAAEKRRKPAYVPTKLTGVTAGNTCFCLYRQSWFVGEFREFIPSSTSAKLDRYIVHVLSVSEGRQVRLVKKVAREGIRFLDDEVISEMKKFGGYKKTIEEKEGLVDDTFRSTAFTRSLTPPSDDNAADTALRPFSKLTLLDQLYRLRPHLLRIISDQYLPAMPRIEAFYSKTPTIFQTGGYANEEMQYITSELQRWALRSGPASGPPLPVGSPRYEAMIPKYRQNFIRNVLAFEAVIQIDILNHHSGSVDDTDEQAQYDAALARLQVRSAQMSDVDWSIHYVRANNAMEEHARRTTKVDEYDLALSGLSDTHRVTSSGRCIKKVPKDMY